MKGNVAERGHRSLRFDAATRTHGVYHYVLEYTWDGDIGVPELVIEFQKTSPPSYPLLL